MAEKKLYYRKVIHLGNTRYIAVGKFLPNWINVFMIITKSKDGSFLIKLECADSGKTTPANNSD